MKAGRSLIFSSRLPAFMFNFEHYPTRIPAALGFTFAWLLSAPAELVKPVAAPSVRRIERTCAMKRKRACCSCLLRRGIAQESASFGPFARKYHPRSQCCRWSPGVNGPYQRVEAPRVARFLVDNATVLRGADAAVPPSVPSPPPS
jgi:hypothetical protein